MNQAFTHPCYIIYNLCSPGMGSVSKSRKRPNNEKFSRIGFMSTNKMLLHAQTLQDAKETIQYQIRHLKKYFSREQRRCWNIRLKRIQASLKAYKSIGIVPIVKQKIK